MTFRELFEKYKKGEAAPDEKRLVEEEIEKNKLINDHIIGELASDPIPGGPDEKVQPDKQSAKTVRRIMRRTLLKTGTIAAVLVLAGFLIANYIVSPIVASRYYDPTKVIRDKTAYGHSSSITQGSLDKQVYFELSIYSDILSSYFAEDLGYGKYHVVLLTQDIFTSEYKTHENWLRLNTAPTENLLKGGILSLYASRVRSQFGRGHFNGPEDIHNIPPDMMVEAAVLFPEDLDMDHLLSVMDDNIGLFFSWAAVRNTRDMPTAGGTMPYIGFMGFRPEKDFAGVSAPPSIIKKYPYLFFSHRDRITADTLTQHFMSLLNYSCDREEEDQRKFQYGYNTTEYGNMAWHQNTLEMIKEKGIEIYGAVVIGKYEDVVSLYDSGVINGIEIYDTKSSVYENDMY